MALIGVQPVQNPGLQPGHYQPREKKSDLDKVLEGLNIANSAMGIAVNYEHINNYMKQNDALDQTAAGHQPDKERLDAMLKGAKPVPEGTPGSQSFSFQNDSPEGHSKQAFIMPDAPKKPLFEHVTNTTKNGKFGTSIFDMSSGKPVEVGFIDQERPPGVPKDVKTREIETVDPATGKPVRVIVEDKPGASYAVPDKADKAPTDAQFQAGLYAKRMAQAENVFTELTDKGFDRTSNKAGLSSYLPGSMKPDDLKRQDQAERNFVNAILRRESGAAISKDEFASAEQQYFPRAGDSPEVLAQKQQNREQSTAGMAATAGPAMAKIPTIAKKEPVTKSDGGTANASTKIPAGTQPMDVVAELAKRGVKVQPYPLPVDDKPDRAQQRTSSGGM